MASPLIQPAALPFDLPKLRGGRFADSFAADRAASVPDAWTVLNGIWSITNGRLKNTGVGIIRSGLSAANVHVAASVFATGPGRTGIVLRVVDASNYYLAQVQADDNTIRLFRFATVPGNATLATVNKTITAVPHTLEARVIGFNIEVFYDGALIISATDTAVTGSAAAGARADPQGAGVTEYLWFQAALL